MSIAENSTKPRYMANFTNKGIIKCLTDDDVHVIFSGVCPICGHDHLEDFDKVHDRKDFIKRGCDQCYSEFNIEILR